MHIPKKEILEIIYQDLRFVRNRSRAALETLRHVLEAGDDMLVNWSSKFSTGQKRSPQGDDSRKLDKRR